MHIDDTDDIDTIPGVAYGDGPSRRRLDSEGMVQDDNGRPDERPDASTADLDSSAPTDDLWASLCTRASCSTHRGGQVGAARRRVVRPNKETARHRRNAEPVLPRWTLPRRVWTNAPPEEEEGEDLSRLPMHSLGIVRAP